MDEGQLLVEWDWVYGRPRFRLLHHVTRPSDADPGDADWPVAGYDCPTACGLVLRAACIPGIFSRMDTPRCTGCCRALGYPRGDGSPRNDPACRPLVQARLGVMAAP